jgi:hypothetical protein
MKLLIKYIALVTAFMLLMAPVTIAQKTSFTGTIVYDVKPGADLPESTKSMAPKMMTYKFSDDKQSMKLSFPMMDQVTIYDPAAKVARILMDILGQKIVVNQSAAEIQQLRKQQGEIVGIKETTETRTIAGYPCKKTIITRKTAEGREIASTIYYTDAIDVSKFNAFSAFPEIKGIALEFSMKTGQMDFFVTARSVTRESIPPSEFVVGPDYRQVSVEDLKKFFGNSAFPAK